jgi:hypothetical protein
MLRAQPQLDSNQVNELLGALQKEFQLRGFHSLSYVYSHIVHQEHRMQSVAGGQRDLARVTC